MGFEKKTKTPITIKNAALSVSSPDRNGEIENSPNAAYAHTAPKIARVIPTTLDILTVGLSLLVLLGI